MFDLENAIAAWRRTYELDDSFSEADVRELEAHLRDAYRAAIERGVRPEEAYRQAVREVGQYGAVSDEYQKVFWRKARHHGEMGSVLEARLNILAHYGRVAFRTLRRYAGYTAINVTGLAVGMACCLLIVVYIRDELSYDRHHEHAARIARLASDVTNQSGNFRTAQTPPFWGPVIADEFPAVEAMTRIKPPLQSWRVNVDDQRFLEQGFVFADSTVFDVFTFPLLEGDARTALVTPFSVVLSESTARRYFGDRTPVGRSILLDNQYEFTVTGVFADPPRTSHFRADLLASIYTLEEPIYTANYFDLKVAPNLYTYVLLRDAGGAESLTGSFDSFKERHLQAALESAGLEIDLIVQPLTSIHLRSNLLAEIGGNGSMETIYLFSAIGLFILVIAAINFINLTTARADIRRREVGVRKVLGAHRGQLIRQFLSESTILAMVAALLAVGIARFGLPLLEDLTGSTYVFSSDDLLTIGAAVAGLTVLIGILAGLYPAFFIARFRPAAILGKGSGSRPGSSILRKGLVVFQFGVAAFLILATTIIFDQLGFMFDREVGFDKEQIMVVPIADRYIQSRYDVLESRIERIGSVKHVTASSSAPGSLVASERVVPEGAAPEESVGVLSFSVDFDFVETMGLEVIAGRDLSRDFQSDTTDAVLLNETAVSTLGWSSPAEAIGKRVKGALGKEGRVKGVVRDFNARSLRVPVSPTMITMRDPSNFFYVLVRLDRDRIAATVDAVTGAWNEVLPDYVFQYSFMDADYDRLYAQEERLGNLFGTFAIIAVVITCLGLFGLASFTVSRRTPEIGIRKVLGASSEQIAALLSREFLVLVVLSFIPAAILGYVVMNRWLTRFAYRIDISIWLVAGTGVLLLAIALLTVGYQAVRAARLDPVESIRME